MADSKITALASIGTGTDPANDPLVIVDVSDILPGGMSLTGTTKKVTLNNLLACSPTATLASATITGDLTVATNRLSVSSTGVQIGTTTNKTTAFTGNGTGLTIGAALAPTIALWDTTNASYVGSISQIDADMYLTNTAVGQMVFSTDNTSRYTISSTGISTWSVGGSTAMTLNSTGLGVGSTPAAPYRILSAKTSGGGQLALTTGAAAGSNASPLNIDLDFLGFTNETRARIRSTDQTSDTGNGFLSFWTQNSGTFTEKMRLSTEGNVGIGVTPSAGKGCLQLSSGINFPATQVASSDANTLDDYEEGTFVPSIGGTATYTTQTGRYVKIGNRVWVTIRLVINTAGTGDDYRISGLPFVVASTISPISVGYFAGLKISVGYISGYANTGTSTITTTATTAASANITNGAGVITNNTDLSISCFYEV